MDGSSATRTELLAVRAQIALALRGRDLLKDKRKALMQAFRKVADAVLAGSDELERAVAESAGRLAEAIAYDGREAVESAALGAAGEITVETRPTVVMGVPLPEVERRPVGRPLTARGYGLTGSSARIDQVADSFENQLDLVLEVAAEELRLKRLAEEIRKVTRRVNALEQVIIPRFERRAARIEAVLDERERENVFRLKRIKARKLRAGVAT